MTGSSDRAAIWALIEEHLAAAMACLDDPSSGDAMAGAREFVEHREYGLAYEALLELATPANVSAAAHLAAAARLMGFD